ncbi:uncharacterized protein I206_102804 [Kwoniella pini CBS 10737]|uniref:Uncharacterized protein n=1 Tax=Kwoniella pini CBS 10737 TaxID=1296096 RepID=A0A1B9I6F1_9TREE|nr:uncharacterized protein I206_03158 [Kwoniella pini CBS 10737]OCF51092.1 hypothetical protein I206_03158 [Kwoniella pini CBS 10737]
MSDSERPPRMVDAINGYFDSNKHLPVSDQIDGVIEFIEELKKSHENYDKEKNHKPSEDESATGDTTNATQSGTSLAEEKDSPENSSGNRSHQVTDTKESSNTDHPNES